MTHPPSDPAAEAVSALREALAEQLLIHKWPLSREQLVPFAQQDAAVRAHYLAKADDLIAGPLAPLLALIAAEDRHG